MTSFGECIPLAATGVQGTIFFTLIALGFIVLGVALSFFTRSFAGKAAALSVGLLLAVSFSSASSNPAFADNPNEPVAITAPTLSGTGYDAVSDTSGVVQSTAATWTNPEGCGSFSYQWQIQIQNSGVLSEWTDYGQSQTSLNGTTNLPCTIAGQGSPYFARLVVNLTNSYGTAQSISPTLSICPRG